MKPLSPVAPKKLLGIHNTQRPERLPFGACSDAVNVIMDDAATLERRSGYVLSKALTTATDGYSAYSHDGLFVLAGGVLSTVSDALALTTLQSGLTDTALQWAELGDRVFYAGATDAGIIADRTHWQPLRIPNPVATVTTPTGTGYTAGQYQVTATYLHTATGIEGPAAAVQRIDVADGKAISVSVPALSGYSVNVYISENNGSIPYCSGVPLAPEQIDAQPLPTGVTALAADGGLLYAAVHDATNDIGFIHWSQPFYHQCWKLAPDYLAVPGKVSGMAAVNGGLLILTLQACWFWNGESLTRLSDYGAPLGRPLARDHEGRWWAWTDHGLCTLADGWKNLTAEHVSVPPGTWCTTRIVPYKGCDYAVIVTDGAGSAANAYTALSGTSWAINLGNAELTRFSNFAFLGFAHLRGVDYGLKATGLYQLTGTTDASADPEAPTAIVASFTTQPTDFGDSRIKRCTYAYLTGCDAATLRVTPTCDGVAVGTYSGARRVRLPRGRSGQFWSFTTDDTGSGPLRLTGFEILVEATSRRI